MLSPKLVPRASYRMIERKISTLYEILKVSGDAQMTSLEQFYFFNSFVLFTCRVHVFGIVLNFWLCLMILASFY